MNLPSMILACLVMKNGAIWLRDDDNKLKNPRNLGSKGNNMGAFVAQCRDEHGMNSSDC